MLIMGGRCERTHCPRHVGSTAVGVAATCCDLMQGSLLTECFVGSWGGGILLAAN
jgi:hypothetical protein